MLPDDAYNNTSMPLTLAIVELHFRDWPAAVAWFRQHLQLETVLEHPAEEYALLQAGSIQLAIKGNSTAVVPSGVLLQWQVPDVLSWQVASTAKTLKPLKTSPEGYRRIIVEGPDGFPVLLFDFNGHPAANGDNNYSPLHDISGDS